MKKWNVIYVASRREKKVALHLSERGIENYVPLVKKMRMWSDRKKLVEFPLLSGYIFVCIDIEQQQQVLQVRGVVSFVKSDDKVAEVRKEEIMAMQSVVKLGYDIAVTNDEAQIEKGEKTIISYGPLKGVVGEVVEKVNNDQFYIFISAIKNGLLIKLPKGCLKPLNQEAQLV